MGKLIVVDRERLKASLRKTKKALDKDPQWIKNKKELERQEKEEKKRRDKEFAVKQREGGA